jgi:hypothetical protein
VKKKNVQKAWREFSQTGAVGAYLTYRAMLIRESERPD